MIFQLLEVVIPVFIVIAAGYLATRAGLLKLEHVDGLMVFTQGFAIPCMLARALYDLDLKAAFDPGLLTAFYAGSIVSFALGVLGARYLFNRRPGEAVAIGFAALFSNSVLLGLAIMERAYGSQSLAPNFAIIAMHAPANYLLGITAMEFARADGRSIPATMVVVARSMFRNSLMIGIFIGAALNLSGLIIPAPALAAVDMMSRAALPAAIFGLGGMLTRYALRASLAEAGMVTFLSLFVHPALTYLLCLGFGLDIGLTRAAVVTAAMAPGVNAYVFANMYNRATDVAASSILLATGASVFTAAGWLWVLG